MLKIQRDTARRDIQYLIEKGEPGEGGRSTNKGEALTSPCGLDEIFF